MPDRHRRARQHDHLYVVGGNAERLQGRMPARVKRVDSAAGILWGHRLWEWGDVP